MPRTRTIPGSIYAQKGRSKLIIKFAGKTHHTGLEDTKEGRKIAQQMLEKMYLESKGIGKKEKSDSISIDEAFGEFLKKYCATLSKASTIQYVAAYKAMVTETKPFILKNVEGYVLMYLQKASQLKHSQTTINNYLRRFQTFLRWCEERYNFPHTDFSKRYRKPVTIDVETFEEWEITALLEYCQAHSSASVKEMAIMIGFMLETGARLTDCLNLKPSNLKNGKIQFRNKVTKETEILPVTDAALDLLKSLPQRTDSVFRWKGVSTSRLRKYLTAAMQACNIEPRGRSFQEFRTTFRNRLLDAGVQPEIAMSLMRHRDMRTTMKHYTKFTDEAMKNALKKAGSGSKKVAQDKQNE